MLSKLSQPALDRRGSSETAVRLLLAASFFILAFHISGTAFGFQQPDGIVRYLVADDSMITLRVANNFAHHSGPYFNVGEHTAANTSLFWPILLSLVFRLYSDAGHAVAMLSLLSSACAALTVSLIVYFARGVRSALSSGVTLLLLPSLAEYGCSVWEHIPQALLVTLAFLIFTNRVPYVGEAAQTEWCLLLLTAAFLLRPDTLPLIVAVIGCALFWRLRWTPSTSASTLVCLSSVISYFALHHYFYDSFVPNTVYLKVTFGMASIRMGLHYVSTSMIQSAFPAFIVALGFLCIWYNRSIFSVREVIVIVALLLQVAYIVFVGGDVFLYGRFFLLIGPTAVILLLDAFWDHWQSPRRTMLIGATGFAVITAVASATITDAGKHLGEVTTFLNGFSTRQSQPYADQAILADYLRTYVRPNDGQIGLFALGALSFYLPEYTIADFLGKADPVIAHQPVRWGPIGHNKWDFEHSLRDRNVSVVPFHLLEDAAAKALVDRHADFAFSAAFQLDPYLRSHYTYRTSAQLHSPGTEGLFIRNDLLSRFDTDRK